MASSGQDTEENQAAARAAKLAQENEQLKRQHSLHQACQQIGELVLGSMDLDTILDNLATEVLKVSIFRSLMVALVDRRNLHVEVACGFVNRRDGDRRLAGTVQRVTDASTGRRYGLQDDNITAEVARSGRLEVIEEWDDRFDDKVDTPESRRGNVSYFIPIKKGEQVLAVLATGSYTTEKEETLERIRLLEPLFKQVAIALDHAFVYKELERSLRAERAMGRVRDRIISTRNIAQLSSDLMPVWKEELTGLGIPVHDVSIQLPTQDPDQFYGSPTFDKAFAPEQLENVHRLDDFPWMRQAWDSGQTVHAAGAELEGRGIRALIEVPLKSGGSIGVSSLEREAFGADAVQVVEEFVQLAAVGLQRIRSFSELEEANRKLSEHAARLERSNRELDEFAFIASHDLKAPLRAVDNLALLIDQATRDILPEDKRRYLDLIKGRIRRMEKLLKDLLVYARTGSETERVQELEMGPLVWGVVESLDIPSGFSVRVAEPLPGLRAAPGPLEQVFLNLVANAVKHHGGKAGRIEIGARDCGERLEFWVADDGPGIDPAYHQKIFKLFQTLKPRDRVEGSGMGLALVSKIVEQHGGAVEVDSSEGAGARFRFTWTKG